jgi:hypothetical protein
MRKLAETEEFSSAPSSTVEASGPGLFQKWWALESGKVVAKNKLQKTGSILAAINLHAGTNYKTNWPAMMAARGYSLERIPVEVRRYMMRKVLDDELKKMGYSLKQKELTALVHALT